MIDLSKETIARAGSLFAPDDLHLVEQLLRSECADNLPLWNRNTPEGLERIRFAVLKLSDGSLDKLQDAIQLAKIDWRDVLVSAGFAEDTTAHKHWFPKK